MTMMMTNKGGGPFREVVEPDMQISSIRLSDKTSRLRPRLVVAKPAQTYFIVGGEMSRGQIGLSTLV